jgi:hypothetical protein
VIAVSLLAVRRGHACRERAIVSDGSISLGASAQSGPLTSTTGSDIIVSEDAVALVSYAPNESPSA